MNKLKKNINQPFIVFELHSFDVHLGKKNMSALILSGSTVERFKEEFINQYTSLRVIL